MHFDVVMYCTCFLSRIKVDIIAINPESYFILFEFSFCRVPMPPGKFLIF